MNIFLVAQTSEDERGPSRPSLAWRNICKQQGYNKKAESLMDGLGQEIFKAKE